MNCQKRHPQHLTAEWFFFDLDIYEPTKVAYDHLKPFICKGDIIYFDEARMADEWKLLMEEVFLDFKFKLIGATFNCLALEVISS